MRRHWLSVQSLEDRCLASATASVNLGGDKILRVVGTDLDNDIVVRREAGYLTVTADDAAVPIASGSQRLTRVANASILGVRIDGNGGNDVIVFRTRFLGTSADNANRAMVVTIFGGAGNDTIIGDLVEGTPRPASQNRVLALGGAGNDSIYGGHGNDTLRGEANDDYVNGGTGNDRVGEFLAAGDVVSGDESGNDTLNGGDGDDWVGGGAGNDSIVGGDGNDSLWGGANNDTLYGGEGNDRLGAFWGANRWLDDAGDDLMAGVQGNDNLGGGTGADSLSGDAGSDTLWGDSGDDKLYGGDDRDALYGGAGADWMDAGSAGEMVAGGGDLCDFNAYVWTVNETRYQDVRGGASWVTAGLAAAAARGVNMASYISYEGSGVYRVAWKPGRVDSMGHNAQFVHFYGKDSLFAADARPVDAGEFWVILYQRAVLQQAGRPWNNPGSGGTYHEPPLYVGRDYRVVAPGNLSAITQADSADRLIMAAIPSGNAAAQALGLPTARWYAVLNARLVLRSGGGSVWLLDLYNPDGTSHTVTHAQFTQCFSSVSVV